MERLMAKSGDDRDPRRWLLNHTQDVIDAGGALFGGDSPTRLGECWLRFFRLPPEAWPTFRRNLLAACALHDWGKANDSFQAAVRRKTPQAIRHEHLSALLIGLPQVSAWLAAGGIDVPLVMSAVLSHHLKAHFDLNNVHGFATALNGVSGFRALHEHEDFQTMIRLLAERLHLAALSLGAFPNSDRWAFRGAGFDVRTLRDKLKPTLAAYKSELRDDVDRRRMLMAVRAGLIAADAAGSGLVREGKPVGEWLAETFDPANAWDGAAVWCNVIEKRLADIEKQKGVPFHWSDFQLACDDLPGRALLLAPCGSGKTLAAWRWIAGQLSRRPASHVLFLYPTRATAREGFKDYVSWAPEAAAALMHGTSEFDLAGMFENPPEGDEREGRSYEVERRLFSLGFWPRRAFSATVDQFLAFMQYGYGPVCMLPVLADSVVVIDEVHSYDRCMLAALKDFLREFDVPVLCMTATLPQERRDELIACGLTPPPAWPDDLQALAEQKRYKLVRVGDATHAAERVSAALEQGKRVLWVVNQVKRAQEIVRRFVSFDPSSSTVELRTADGATVVCYHSRFRLRDRVERHAETMRALKELPGPALGVTTQVCEMSLDIDADLLVTDECPVTSLVQRMGRCNRASRPRALERSGEVLVYRPDVPAPYSPNDLIGLSEFLDALDGKDLSQYDLEAAMLDVPCPEPEGDPLSRFIAGNPYAVGPKEDDGEGFREGNDFNRPCVLPEDVEAFNWASAREKPGYVLPVPKKLARSRDELSFEHRKLPTYLGVAAPGHYHAAIGYCDAVLDEPEAE